MPKKPAGGQWPYGNPTETCRSCQGAAVAAGEWARIAASRVIGDKPRACPICEGRGKVIAHAAPVAP